MTEQHLRVVDAAYQREIVSISAPLEAGSQLELDLGDDPTRTILVAAMDRLHGLRLHELVAEIHPVAVLDLRSTIRFDLPGTNRLRFLETISQIRSCYMRAPMAWHGDLRAAVHADVQLPGRLRHEVVERCDGNLMLLVNKAEHVLRISSMLNVALTRGRARRWFIEQAV